jgi:hypothetical protein
MTEREFHKVYPRIIEWIHDLLAGHAADARAVGSLGFKRLPRYYGATTLAAAKVVVVAQVPVPPLSAMGLSQFSKFEEMASDGITYLDTYFVRAERGQEESLHFHELVHVIQWRLLGPGVFLAVYAAGLERFGYRKSPLETTAYDLQARFDLEAEPFDAEAACQQSIQKLGNEFVWTK